MSSSPPHNLSSLMHQSEWVRALARTLVRDPEAAEDLAQDALAIALERPPEHAQNLRGWFARVLRNLDRQRRRRAGLLGLEQPEALRERSSDRLPAEEVVLRAEEHRVVVEEVLDLHEPYRATVLLRYFDDLQPTEIAAQLRLPVATVTSRLTRAHALLRTRLDRRHGADGQAWMTALLPLLPRRGPGVAAVPGALVMSTSFKVILAVVLVAGGWAAVRNLDQPSVSPQSIVPEGTSGVTSEQPEIIAEAAGSAVREEVLAETPSATADSEALTHLAGIVFTPDGQAAPGAFVVIDSERGLAFIDKQTDPDEKSNWCETDSEGRFSFSGIPSGPTPLTAGAVDFAPSVTSILEFEAELPQRDLRLVLRTGGRIHGEVYRRDGSLAADRKVRLLKERSSTQSIGIGLMRYVHTDDKGRFDAQHLSPGAWGLVTFPSKEELLEFGGNETEDMHQATVTLEDGGEAFVELGADSASKVTVSGSVRDAEGPTGGLMQWIAECDDPMGSQVVVKIDKDGQYMAELPAPGAWYMRIMATGIQTEHYVDVPEVAEHRLDFELPRQRLSGFVLSASGAPLSGAWVSHMTLKGSAYRLGLSLAVDQVKSAEDGSFAFVGFEPGTYQLGVTHADGVAEVLTVTVGQDEHVEDLELVVITGKPISGTVLGLSGVPVSGAPIWIQDHSGAVLNPVTRVRTTSDGSFTTPPLPSGEYTVLTQVGVLVGLVDGVRPGSENAHKIELHLEEGAAFQVKITSGEEVLRGHVRVTDMEGRVFSGLRSARDPWSWRRYSFDSRSKTVGPLPPGDYRITVHVPGRGTVERELTLSSKENRQVTLAL